MSLPLKIEAERESGLNKNGNITFKNMNRQKH